MSRPPRGAALITGSSSGIGLALARRFAADGWRVVLHGRDPERLGEAAAELGREDAAPAFVVARDLADPAAPQEIHDELTGAGLGVEALVNNAGLGAHGPFADMDLEAALGMLRVNVLALTHLTRLFLPPMVERGRGRVLNVSSTAGFQPGPLMAAYYATKAYVLSFSEALAEEVRGSGVTVTVLCPGPTRTRFQERAAIEDTRLLSGALLPVMSAERVARAGYVGMMRGKRLVVPGLVNRLLVHAQRVSPRGANLRIVKALNERRRDAR